MAYVDYDSLTEYYYFRLFIYLFLDQGEGADDDGNNQRASRAKKKVIILPFEIMQVQHLDIKPKLFSL